MAEVRTSVRVDEPAVRHLAERAEQTDRVAPLDEATLLALRGGADALHLTVHDAGSLVGYAQVRPDATGYVAELVVDPDHRRRGIGTCLLRALQEQRAGRQGPAEDLTGAEGTEPRPLEVWAHGDLPEARKLLAAVGARPVRELWVLGRDVTDQPDPLPPPGVRLRPFRVGEDEAAWLAVNARAFADHPEQGRTTLADLLVREREPWFDPDGLVLAVTGDRLLGSVWTKVREREHVGEIYVLGVDPAAQGTGLGGVLTDAGLGHLARRGVPRVILFVEADNEAALATYHRAGFAREAVHTRHRLQVTLR